jgi:hypothetical protein
MKMMIRRNILPLFMVIFLAACANQKETPLPTATQVATSEVSKPSETEVVEQPINETDLLPPEPTVVLFSAQDGQELQGLFYPAAKKMAPVIVLMHWYPGDQTEWTEIAYWLQNRGLQGKMNGVPWKNPSWFPSREGHLSYNVLTFTFRNCMDRCKSPEPDAWLLDAQASLEYARTLAGVDPDRVIAIGASIGADGAIDGCAAVLEEDASACLGALSLSPGSYLGLDYSDEVSKLGNSTPPKPAWCLYDKNDADSVVCTKASGNHYYHESWGNGNLHGLHLIDPNLEPNPLTRILEFLALVSKTK